MVFIDEFLEHTMKEIEKIIYHKGLGKKYYQMELCTKDIFIKEKKRDVF